MSSARRASLAFIVRVRLPLGRVSRPGALNQAVSDAAKRLEPPERCPLLRRSSISLAGSHLDLTSEVVRHHRDQRAELITVQGASRGVERWRDWNPIGEKYLCLFFDGTNLSMRRGNQIVMQCVLVAVIDPAADRELLGSQLRGGVLTHSVVARAWRDPPEWWPSPAG